MIYDDEEAAEIRCPKSEKGCKFQYSIPEAIAAASVDASPLCLYHMPPITFDLTADSNVQSFFTWLKNQIGLEELVCVIDPYITNNMQSFIKWYLPLIQKGAVLAVFVGYDTSNQSPALTLLKEAARQRQITLHVFRGKQNGMHDRFITTKELEISIGLGLDIANSDDKVRKNTHVTLRSKNPKKDNNNYAYEIALAGGADKMF